MENQIQPTPSFERQFESGEFPILNNVLKHNMKSGIPRRVPAGRLTRILSLRVTGIATGPCHASTAERDGATTEAFELIEGRTSGGRIAEAGLTKRQRRPN